MEKRPENEQRMSYEANASDNGNKSAIIVLTVLAVILAGVLGYVIFTKGKLVKELNVEKAELTAQLQTLQDDYASLSSDYATINAQLDSSREEVNQLIERVRKTDATNRAKIRKYEKELGTLRSIMRNYIVQIDSLNTLNHKLTRDAARARRETEQVKREKAELEKTVEALSDKVETGAIVRGRNIKAEVFNANGKKVDKAAAANRVLVSVTLAENNLAASGPVRVYVVITDPDGNLLTNSKSTICTYAGAPLETSASREVDYQGNEVDLSIYMNDVAKYVKGVYNVQVLTEQTLLGTTQFMLR